MVYVDTSVLVALYLPEVSSADVERWYSASDDDLVSSAWCVTEFASALSIKQRTGQINADAAQKAWQQFERLCANDLQLLPTDPSTFHRAAILALDTASSLRAGDALHLAAAQDAKARSMATLDDVLAKNAKRLKMKLVF
jgi:predicted nucleic acid-binding protein